MNTNNKETFTANSIDRLREISDEMQNLMDEFKGICRKSMTADQYQQFKYRTLGHIEPILNKDSEWFNKYSSLDSLDEVIDKYDDSPGENDDEKEEYNHLDNE